MMVLMMTTMMQYADDVDSDDEGTAFFVAP